MHMLPGGRLEKFSPSVITLLGKASIDRQVHDEARADHAAIDVAASR
jgi:hypothetical protein